MSGLRVAKLRKRSREARRRRVRSKIVGTASRPRISVFRSNTSVYAQAIDDASGTTIAAVSDQGLKGKNKTERARAAGKKLGELLNKAKISSAVFDRAGFLYHGRVAAVAEGVREEGLTL